LLAGASNFESTTGTIVRARALFEELGIQCARVAAGYTTLPVVIYRILTTRKPYVELGVGYFNQLDAGRVGHHRVRRLEQLRYTVTLTPLAV